jgi:hypothetical protein
MTPEEYAQRLISYHLEDDAKIDASVRRSQEQLKRGEWFTTEQVRERVERIIEQARRTTIQPVSE